MYIDGVNNNPKIDSVNIDMNKKKPIHSADRKQALYAAAVSLLDSEGISAVTIRAIAREVGVSHAAPVNHFRDRSALLTEIAVQQFQAISDAAAQQFASIGLQAAERVEVVPNVMFDFGLEYPKRYQLLWRRDLVDWSDERLVRLADGIYDALCDEISAVIQKRNFDRDTVATALWSVIHGYLEMRHSGMFEEQSDLVSGAPRRRAMLDLFRAAIGGI